MRSYTGQHLIKDHAKPVDVARDRDWFTFGLFRRSRDRRKSLSTKCSEFDRIRIVPDDLGNSKIKQLWLSLAINKNIVWFQIAVNDRITMRCFYCSANFQEKVKSSRQPLLLL